MNFLMIMLLAKLPNTSTRGLLSISYDSILTKKLGLSQSLMVQEGAHNCNKTLNGYPKKFWGLFGLKPHKTQQITLKTKQIIRVLFYPKKRFILNP